MGFGWSHSLVIFVMTGLRYVITKQKGGALKWSFRRSFIPFPERREEHKMRVSPHCPVTSDIQSPDQTIIGMVTGHSSPITPRPLLITSNVKASSQHKKHIPNKSYLPPLFSSEFLHLYSIFHHSVKTNNISTLKLDCHRLRDNIWKKEKAYWPSATQVWFMNICLPFRKLFLRQDFTRFHIYPICDHCENFV